MPASRRYSIIDSTLKVESIGTNRQLMGYDPVLTDWIILATFHTGIPVNIEGLLANKKTLARALRFNLIETQSVTQSANDPQAAFVIRLGAGIMLIVSLILVVIFRQ